MSLPPEAYETAKLLIPDCLEYVLTNGEVDKEVGTRTVRWLYEHDRPYSCGGISIRDNMLMYRTGHSISWVEALKNRMDRIIFLTQGGSSEPVPSEQASADVV